MCLGSVVVVDYTHLYISISRSSLFPIAFPTYIHFRRTLVVCECRPPPGHEISPSIRIQNSLMMVVLVVAIYDDNNQNNNNNNNYNNCLSITDLQTFRRIFNSVVIGILRGIVLIRCVP